MIRKLFGETEEEQFRYLQPRLIALGVGIVIILISFLLMQVGVPFGDEIGSLGVGICVITLLVFGWTIMRGLLGFASLGALFSGNVVIGVVIFVLFLMIGYLGGFFVLLKKKKGNN
ncbi:MAG: hypothetical protein ACI4E5_08505 [Suilimivivens sp.]